VKNASVSKVKLKEYTYSQSIGPLITSEEHPFMKIETLSGETLWNELGQPAKEFKKVNLDELLQKKLAQ